MPGCPIRKKIIVKFFITCGVFCSMAYLLMFLAPKETQPPRHAKKPSEEPNFVRTLQVKDPWTCEQLTEDMSSQKAGFQFSSMEDLTKSPTTSYCLGMMESFKRCIGFVQHSENPEHLLPNPFLTYSKSLTKFGENIYKYRSSHIYFVHVMKSSGSSLEGVLSRHRKYKNGDVKLEFRSIGAYYCSNMLLLYKLSETEPTKRFISIDKRSYGLHRMVKSPGYYVTILRHPVDRFVSMYYYIKQNRYPSGLGDQLFEEVFESKDLDEFLRNTKGKQIPFFDNHSIRMFQFDHYPDLFSTFSGGPDTYIKGVTQLLAVNQSHYNEAVKNLRSCAFVGITEKFKESQQMLETMLGLDLSEKEVRSNVNPNYEKYAVTSEQGQAIEARVMYDMMLYNEAKAIFDSQYQVFQKLLEDTE